MDIRHGDLVKHIAGGPNMIVIGFGMSTKCYYGTIEEFEECWSRYKPMVVCRYFVDRKNFIGIANSSASGSGWGSQISSSSKVDSKSFEKEAFYENELKIIKKK